MSDVRLIRIAQLYFYVNYNDHAYSVLLKDPRAQEITEAEVEPLWAEGDATPTPDFRLGTKGLSSLCWASLHCHRHNIDFDFLDIGANIGMEGIAQAILHKRCGWSNRVYLFEPGSIFPLLDKSIHINRVADVATAIHAAVTDGDGRETFYFLPETSAGSSLLVEKVFQPNVTVRKELEIDTITVDTFVRQHMRSALALIAKIDTEGADFKVLDGMRKTFRDRLVIVQFEFIPVLVESYTRPVSRLAELAEEFILINVGHEQRRHVIPLNEIGTFVERARKCDIPPDICLLPKRLPDVETLEENILRG